MVANVIGKKKLDFVDGNGKRVEVYTIFCVHKNPLSDNITEYEGQGCSQVNLPLDTFNKVNVDQQYILDFDRKGKLLEITEIG